MQRFFTKGDPSYITIGNDPQQLPLAVNDKHCPQVFGVEFSDRLCNACCSLNKWNLLPGNHYFTDPDLEPFTQASTRMVASEVLFFEPL